MDKRKKFHKALLKLYCPPPSPAEPLAVDSASLAKEEPLEFPSLDDHLDSDTVLNDSENGGESKSQRLTRAQRKRIRRRKLKEAASVQRKFIGPMLPPGYGDDEQRQSTD
ncbi:hypothetical protein AXF42_Ash004148 [Apostasia shenzhenica]|uniref:Uncharacterized protein n=1 Tax=Apostasia shenzhenica TaxID=1088818 RepID=A0A2I0A243_9ASPA|nr:hypothetical protein AXF42_Ash004148 [Apostasia shenzhenica]